MLHYHQERYHIIHQERCHIIHQERYHITHEERYHTPRASCNQETPLHFAARGGKTKHHSNHEVVADDEPPPQDSGGKPTAIIHRHHAPTRGIVRRQGAISAFGTQAKIVEPDAQTRSV
eukprot:Polyplicarium_translucidae@DN1582_c0_g1_i2.p1